ncbi:MAG: AbrB/MazE/SpoVT family DNA-binding domain-containing protein [Deltaproteobacteria bacterium HGW-Deltaproteobacteria-12]|jgi:antitoxin MazE|nr:MAG: AbrB/MazE/SpoVT family DNA-binding domain-containing protein [Deltaproteobacteria bacterium HGW-Deltaproteobacteria-12]
MRASIIRIGNSQGIRIPKPFLDQTGIMDAVEVEIEKNQIIIRPISNPRADWDSAFRAMAENGQDAMLDGNESIANSWDEEEWQW